MPSPSPVSEARVKRRICLVTSEFHGLFKNGGIGTANTGLALALAEAGHDVVVAYVDPTLVDIEERQRQVADLVEDYLRRGVRLEFVPRHPWLRAGHEDHVAASYSVFGYLQGRGFDRVFFNECGGQGYFSMLARRAGSFPDAPRMAVVTHGSNAWVLELNAQLYWGLHPIAVNFLERRSVELADDLISPSAYLVEWMHGAGWKLPARTRVIQNVLPSSNRPAAAPGAVTELVFFGRLETRKGLETFMAAVSALCERRDMTRVAITLLGKFSRVGGVHSGVYVVEQSRRWPKAPRIIVEYDQTAALDYLRRPGALAVMPSHAENSPCVVAECLLAGVPFLATDSGGTRELVHPDDRASCLCAPDPAALAEALARALDGGARPGRMAVPQAVSLRSWLELADERSEPDTRQRASTPRVSLCLVHEASRAPSAEAVDALLAQTAGEFEIVTVAYGEGAPATPDSLKARWRHEPALARAAARNRAAEIAGGAWLLFVDERDVVLKKEALAGFLDAALRLDAAIVTTPALEYDHAGAPIENWDGRLGLIPTGANLELAAFENCLGEGAFLIERGRFEAVGGFDADASDALADRLLLTKAALAGARLEVAPTPLFWRRARRAGPAESLESAADQRRLLRAYAGEPIAHVAQAMESVIASGPRNRERVAAALSGLGVVARDIATRLSFAPMRDNPDNHRPFVDYCIARGRYREAVEFATFIDQPGVLAFARAAADAAAEKAAVGAMRDLGPPRAHSVALTRLAADRARSVSPLADSALLRSADKLIAYPLRTGVTVVKAAGVCPPRATRIEAIVGWSGSAVRVAVGLAVVDRFAQVRLDGESLVADEGVAWSGWRSLGEADEEIRIAFDLSGPADRARDVFLFSRCEGVGASGSRLTWARLSADVSVFELATPSMVFVDPGATALPRQALARAELVTPAEDFPGAYFVAGEPTTHHPLVGRPAVVRVRQAVFAGATGVRAVFSTENEQSRPVEFAFWVRATAAPAYDVPGLANSEGFSGWTVVRDPFRQHQAEIRLTNPLRAAHDLYLATRVVEFPDNNYCHAVWHDLFVLEAPRAPS